MTSLFFHFFAAIMLLASFAVILARNPMYNVLSLVVVIFSLSSLFMLLEAYFVGIILLMVYAGAVLVFFLFVVMILNLHAKEFISAQQSRFRLLGAFAGAMFLATFALAIKSFLQVQGNAPESMRGTVEEVGKILFTDYLLPFELTSLLLLIAIFGIVALAQGAFKTEGSKT